MVGTLVAQGQGHWVRFSVTTTCSLLSDLPHDIKRLFLMLAEV